MITLFDQEYAVEAYAKAYAKDERRTGEIKTTVEMCQDFGTTIEEAVQKLISKFGISRNDSAEYVKEYWKN